jgi:hypothetical protein
MPTARTDLILGLPEKTLLHRHEAHHMGIVKQRYLGDLGAVESSSLPRRRPGTDEQDQ